MRSNIIDVKSLPVLPELADQVIRMALEDDVSIAKISGLIEKDQALTARILSMANSSFYKRSHSVYTVRDSIAVIGFDAVRTLALGISILDIFPSKKGTNLDYKAFWRHSIACALFAEALMESQSDPNTAKAFCAGLLHDIGKVVLDLTRPVEYASVLKQAQEESRPLIEIEKEVLGTTHCDVAREVLGHWKLPKLYEESVWCHHAPVKILDDEQYRVSWVVHVANILTHMTFIGSSGNNYPQRITNPLLKRFGLSSELLDAVMERVPKQIDAIFREIGIEKPAEGMFGIINKANMRLADISLKLQQNVMQAQSARLQSEVLIELFSDLNSSTKISDALEKAAGRLFDAGLILSFLGGMQVGGHNLVYEVTSEKNAKFVKLGSQELKSMILANNALVGMMLSSGVFIYFEPVTPEIGDDHRFVSTVIGAISSSLRRIYMENAIHEEKDILRKALQSASEEKQKAEDALRLNQELIEASPNGLCLVDDANVVRIENESSLEIRRQLAISGRNLVKALSEIPNNASAELKKAIESRKLADVLWHENDRSFRFETRPIRINNWMLIMFSDITSELGDQRKNIAYAKMSIVGNLAASMAHNMKSPVGAIHGFGSIIKDDIGQGRIQVLRDGKKDEDFNSMISNIITGSENVLKIVNQLLNFTRKFDSPEGEIDVDVFLDGILQIISPQANSSSVRVRKDVNVQTVRIKAEAIEQVLINILINAVKASSQGSEVVVSASRRDGSVEFAVSDAGIGMSPDQLPRIFDPLYTAWPVKTGMGLGLSLAKDIVESMEGRIEVISDPGKGTTFTIRIPEGKG